MLIILLLLSFNTPLLCDHKQYRKADNFLKLGLTSQKLAINAAEEDPARAMSHMANSIYFNVHAMQNGKTKAPSYIIDPANNSDLLNLFKNPVMRKNFYAAVRKNTQKKHTLSTKNCTDFANLVRYNGKITEILDSISERNDSKSLKSYTRRYIKAFNQLLSVYNPELIEYKNKLLINAHSAFKQKNITISRRSIKAELKTLNKKFEQEMQASKDKASDLLVINRLFKNSIHLMANDRKETRQSGYKNFYKAFNMVMHLPHSCDGYAAALVENAFRELNPKIKSKELQLPAQVAIDIGVLGTKFENRLKQQ